jgi:hypothetical protein
MWIFSYEPVMSLLSSPYIKHVQNASVVVLCRRCVMSRRGLMGHDRIKIYICCVQKKSIYEEETFEIYLVVCKNVTRIAK